MLVALADAKLVDDRTPVPPARLRGNQAAAEIGETAVGTGPGNAVATPPPEPPITAPTMFAAIRDIIGDEHAARRLLEYFTAIDRPAGTDELFRSATTRPRST